MRLPRDEFVGSRVETRHEIDEVWSKVESESQIGSFLLVLTSLFFDSVYAQSWFFIASVVLDSTWTLRPPEPKRHPSLMTWTADSFVKALRQSNDVQLAFDAYSDQSFYLPAKPQLLADWALSRLLRHPAAVEDVKIWLLLHEILLGHSSTAPSWLPAVLYKIPVVPILTSIFRLLVESPQQEQLLECALPVLRFVLPIAYQKTRLDTILECLWACVEALSSVHIDALVSDLARLGLDGFSPAFHTANNKGKVRVSITRPILY